MSDKEKFIKRTSKSWVSEQILKYFQEIGFEELLEEGLELIRARRVLDFTISQGVCSARVFGETGAPSLVTLSLPVIEDEGWEAIYESLAKRSLYLASFLAGVLPTEITESVEEAGQSLFPKTGSDFQIEVEDEKLAKLDARAAAVIYKFCENLADNPFNLIVFRGRGREETIVEIRRKRSLNSQKEASASGVHIQQVHAEHSSEVPLGEEFWNSGSSVEGISYNIKADELPAAILRHLDPIPLNGLEDEVDRLLEEAYDHVTKRAQAYGLGLS